MGTWSPKTFDNDAAADWLYDLEESLETGFLLAPLHAVKRTRGSVDLDDALEALAAAEILASARYEPPRDLPRIARSWIKRFGFIPANKHLQLAIKAVERIASRSELADQWNASGDAAGWRQELRKLSSRLSAAIRVRAPVRKPKSAQKRETLAELILAVGDGENEERREELHRKLASLSNPNRPVGGTWKGEKLNSLTPLHWVASRGMVREAKLLLERGATVDPQLMPFAPPMVFAMDRRSTKMVNLLLNAGSDPQKALSHAIQNDRIGLVRMIVARGVDPEETTESGWTSLMWAANCGAVRTLKFLLEGGGGVNRTHGNGNTALHFAVDAPSIHWGDRNLGRFLIVVKMLVKHGARLNGAGEDGKTPLDLADETAVESRIGRQIAQYLREQGARNGKRRNQLSP